MGAHIDLTPLFQLLTQVPTADTQANTPDADIGSVGKYLNQSGVIGSDGTIDTTKPYTDPSNWQRQMYPTQSQHITDLNNQVTQASQNIARIPSFMLPTGVNTQQETAMGYGTGQTPSELNYQNTAVRNAQGGLPQNVSTSQTTQAAGEASRAHGQQALQNQDLYNSLNRAFGLTPREIDLAINQLQAKQGTFPLEEQIREKALDNRWFQEQNITPIEQDVERNRATLNSITSHKALTLAPYETGIMENNAVSGLAKSQEIPVEAPFASRIHDGVIEPPSRNPLGMSQIEQQMQMMKDYTNSGMTPMTLPSGQKIFAPAAPRQALNPLTRQSTATLTATNMPGPAVPDQSGSATPPVTNSLTTLEPSPSESHVTMPAQGSISSFQKSDGSYDYKSYYASNDVAGKASDSLQNILHKYDKTFKEGGWDVPTMNRSDATDYISQHAKMMSHDDLKQALNLLHQLPE